MDFKRVIKIRTGDVVHVAASRAIVNAEITDIGDYIVKDHGHCWSLDRNPDIIDDRKTWHGEINTVSAFESELDGLEPNNTYYVRAYAHTGNQEETVYGEEISFTTFRYEDIEGNGYNSVVIGDREWMKENLRTRHYPDGSPVEQVVAYEHNEDRAGVYGLLYSWNGAMNGAGYEGAQGVCPDGWHIPSAAEFQQMLDHLGGNEAAKWKIMETGNEHWVEDNSNATNETGFTALPGGHFVDLDGYGFQQLGVWCNFWTSTALEDNHASHVWMSVAQIGIDFEVNQELEVYSRREGTFFCVRCIRN